MNLLFSYSFIVGSLYFLGDVFSSGFSFSFLLDWRRIPQACVCNRLFARCVVYHKSLYMIHKLMVFMVGYHSFLVDGLR